MNRSPQVMLIPSAQCLDLKPDKNFNAFENETTLDFLIHLLGEQCSGSITQ